MSSKTRSPAGRDDRILALLNTLGERLARSEKDQESVQNTLEKYNRLFNALEDKAANSERAVRDLQSVTVNRTEDGGDLRAWQLRIEQEQARQAAQLARTEDLSRKIEEALHQQARLNRRLEKIADDRTRLLRKLESIEETILETRDALHGGTPYLPAATGAAQLPASPLLTRRPFLRVRQDRALFLRAVGVAAFVVLAACGAVAALQLSAQPDVAPATISAVEDAAVMASAASSPAPASNAQAAAQDELATALAAATLPVPEQTLSLPGLETYPAADVSEPANADTAAPSAMQFDDVMDMSGADLLHALENQPDALAAALNQIEPEAVDTTAPATEAETPPGAVPFTGFVPEDDAAIEDFVRQQTANGTLADRIQLDTDLPSVIREIEKKAFEGVPEAQHDLAAIYTAGHAGADVDYKRAAAWFTEAALNGIANARYNLGVLYHQGLGVQKDIPRAINWYRAAARLGHPEAQYNLGIAYIEGIGTAYDAARAAAHFEHAARSGVMEAAYNLGLIYENGLLGAAGPGPREALYWYKRAADQGSADARSALEQLSRTLNIEPDAVDALYEGTTPASPPAENAATPPNATEDKDAPDEQTGIEKSEALSLRAQEQAVTAQIQEQLIRLGLYPGPADGFASPQMEDAIRTYQVAAGLTQDGKPTETLLVHLLTGEIETSHTAAGAGK